MSARDQSLAWPCSGTEVRGAIEESGGNESSRGQLAAEHAGRSATLGTRQTATLGTDGLAAGLR